MAHYAFLDKNNIIVEVITGIDETEKIEGLDPETWYGNFRNMRCVRTSYNGRIRGKYAGVGDSYDDAEDIFIAPQPYPSWVRNGSFWEAPIMRTNDLAIWNENKKEWVNG